MALDIIKYERNWIDGVNRGDVAAADESFAPNCIIHMVGAPEPNLSVSAFKELIAGLLVAFPDLHVTVEDQIASGNKVAFRWVAKGTHNGPLGETQPTAKQVQLDGLIIDHVAGDQVVERWEMWDQMAMLKQLGLV